MDCQAEYRRQGTVEDVIRGIVLCNELHQIASCMPLVTPVDVSPFMADLCAYALCAPYSKRPYSVYVLDPESARQTMRLRDIVRDEPTCANDEVRVTTGPRPNGSLSYDESSLDITIIFAKAGYRVQSGGMTMAGLDAPVTLTGTLVIQNTYSLIGITVSYLLGVPANCAGAAQTMDLRHSMCSFGSPNQVLLGLAVIQLAPYYGLDAGVNSGRTDACIPDFQGGF